MLEVRKQAFNVEEINAIDKILLNKNNTYGKVNTIFSFAQDNRLRQKIHQFNKSCYLSQLAT